eukprot:jgi/Ulvmu1/9077/UM005_0172.1
MAPAGDVSVLDGGMGHLIKTSFDIDSLGLPFNAQFAASNLAAVKAPDVVVAAHTAYIEAGCDTITTNNYVSTQYHFTKANVDVDPKTVWQAAVECARTAATQATKKVAIAGCIPPLGESYETQIPTSRDAAMEEYRGLAAAMGPSCEVLLCETMSSSEQAELAYNAVRSQGKSTWVSMTLRDDSQAVLRSLEPVSEALPRVQQSSGPPSAYLLNCCSPQAITNALPQVAAFSIGAGIKCGAYANGFQVTTTQWMEGDSATEAGPPRPEGLAYDAQGILTADAYGAWAANVVAAGAGIVGGCCGVGPEHMRRVVQLLGSNDG